MYIVAEKLLKSGQKTERQLPGGRLTVVRVLLVGTMLERLSHIYVIYVIHIMYTGARQFQLSSSIV